LGGQVSHRGTRLRRRLVPTVVLLVALAGSSGCAGSPFDTFVDEYVNDATLTDASDLASPYRVGRLVAVDPKGEGVDERLQNALPADLRAADDEEVGTIVWISCGESPVGVYEDVDSNQERGRAYQGFCDVAVIDRAASLIVARRTFDASEPPSTTTSRGDVHTVVDVEDVVRFLVGLPEEPSHAPATAAAPALEPGSSLTITLSGPDSGTYSRTAEEIFCSHTDGDPLDEWSVIDIVAAENDESLGFFSFTGRLGSAPADVGSGTTDLETEVIIGPLVSGRRYAVSTSAGGSGTFSLDDRDVSATLTFVGETASGVRMAWTAECMRA